MSLVEPDKLIVLISELEEFLTSWKMLASDAFALTEKNRMEVLDVCNRVEKDKCRSMETEESDNGEAVRLNEKLNCLYEECRAFKQLSSSLSGFAEIRVQKWTRSYENAKRYVKDAGCWLNVAKEEFRRAQNEKDKAEYIYNCQLNTYNSAVSTFQGTPQVSEVVKTDLKGQAYKEYVPNPEYEIARINMETQEEVLHLKKNDLDAKKQSLCTAEDQFNYAVSVVSLAGTMLEKSKHYLEKSLLVKEWASYADNSASCALNSADSVQNTCVVVGELCEKQRNINETMVSQYEKIKSNRDQIVHFVQKISEQTDACCTVANRFVVTMGKKKELLHQLSAILPDKVSSLNLY